jgi:hypothetical protein
LVVLVEDCRKELSSETSEAIWEATEGAKMLVRAVSSMDRALVVVASAEADVDVVRPAAVTFRSSEARFMAFFFWPAACVVATVSTFASWMKATAEEVGITLESPLEWASLWSEES